MFQRFTRWLLTKQLRYLLARTCDDRIPRSGERGQEVNCFAVYLQDGRLLDVALTRLEANMVFGLQWNEYRFENEVNYDVSAISESTLHVTHYYGLYDIHFNGLFSLTIGRLTGWHYVIAYLRRRLNRLAQAIFNRRTLQIRQRLEVLQDVVDLAFAGSVEVDSLDLLTKRYGHRWTGHPQREKHGREIRTNLGFLADTGELSREGAKFRATGQALKMLQNAAEDDRRHRANLRVQWLLAVLTLVSALMAVAQAGLVKPPPMLDFRSTHESRSGQVDDLHWPPSPSHRVRADGKGLGPRQVTSPVYGRIAASPAAPTELVGSPEFIVLS